MYILTIFSREEEAKEAKIPKLKIPRPVMKKSSGMVRPNNLMASMASNRRSSSSIGGTPANLSKPDEIKQKGVSKADEVKAKQKQVLSK